MKAQIAPSLFNEALYRDVMTHAHASIFITRFAPSPTGLLHLGHAYSAILAHDAAHEACGRFLLRIEDIDQTRCRPELTNMIFEDLEWLGLKWEVPVRIQSEHFIDYRSALNRLNTMGLTYPCHCTRKDIEAEIARSATAPHGPEGKLYPGICRPSDNAEPSLEFAPHAIRLNMAKAIAYLKSNKQWPLTWTDTLKGKQVATPEIMGDVVLARKDTPTSYHLSVTVDDALQGVRHVIRGEDLFEATHLHVLLQALLGFRTPLYHHHGLITAKDGKRLAKRDAGQTLMALREEGKTPDDVRRMIGLS